MQLASIYLLRAALIAGIYVVVLIIATINPLPGLSPEVFEWVNGLTEGALVVGAIAPLLAIAGVLLTLLGHRRFTKLDWVSLVFGVGAVLWPALFLLAYSNCPHGVC